MVCLPAISEAGARRPNVLSNYGVLCPTRITRTLDRATFGMISEHQKGQFELAGVGKLFEKQFRTTFKTTKKCHLKERKN
jgi:hypothetical protein